MHQASYKMLCDKYVTVHLPLHFDTCKLDCCVFKNFNGKSTSSYLLTESPIKY